MAAQIADLPSSLLMEILSRLPLKSLLICRCVCKNWLLLFKDHFFVKLQLAKSPNWIVRSGYSLDEETSEVKILCFVDEEESIDGGGGGCRIETAVIDLPAHPYRCFNSCNGLLCVEAEGPCGEILVGNPILREWITIHPPPDESSMYAFGFSPKSNEYKVLSFQGRSPGQCASSIYTLGTGLWRILEGTRPLSLGFALNAFMNGSLHWISDCSKPSRFISYFDFDSERFGSLALPPHTYHHRCTVELSVLNGRLSATIDDSDEFVKIWSMMEYGSEESWTVMHTIEYRTPSVLQAQLLQGGEMESSRKNKVEQGSDCQKKKKSQAFGSLIAGIDDSADK